MGSSSADVERVEAVVVGAGWNGLICAKTYLDFRPSASLLIIDDQASIGGVWSADKIYPSLYAQIKHGLFEYSFYPMRHEGISPDGYVSGDTIHTYLNDFAWDHDLVRRTRLGTRVTEVSQLPGGGWRLELYAAGRNPGGPNFAIECEKLIYASGATSHAVRPVWPTDDSFKAPTIHSSELGTNLVALDSPKVRSVTVVGGAKSSFDTVFYLLKAGKKVDWIIRDTSDGSGSGPMAIMPPTLLGFVNTMTAVTTRVMVLLGSSVDSTDGAGHQFFQRTYLGRFLAWLFWLALNWIADRHAGYSKSENASKLRPMPHGNGVFWANAGLGAASVPGYWQVFHSGDCTVHRTDIQSFHDTHTVRLADGTRFQTDFVILSTGFDKSYHVFGPDLQHNLGLAVGPEEQQKWTVLGAAADKTVDELFPALRKPPAGLGRSKTVAEAGTDTKEHAALHGPSNHYRRLIVPALAAAGDRSIIFPGFIHTIYTPIVAEVQALWGVTFLLGLHDPPSLGSMEGEVALWNAWSRKRYGVQGQKHAYAIYDFLPYIDVLLRDLGVNPRRKKNWFAHWFAPTYPREYKGLVDEFRSALAVRKGSYGLKGGLGSLTPSSTSTLGLS
ncbi:cofactor FMO1 FAD enzyme [Chaetomium sp. MPI-SDFR-AT-0129]|nr:cofactor FMO1 FAD enzyme [Chaetomium sp. MPI-SDFR-AT-0129]